MKPNRTILYQLNQVASSLLIDPLWPVYQHVVSVRSSLLFKFKRNEQIFTACLAVVWPSGSLTSPVLFTNLFVHCPKYSYHETLGKLMLHTCSSSCHFFDNFDPLGRPTVTAGRDHCFCTCRPSIRPHFSKSSKTKQSENNVHYWRDCGLGRVDHWWHLSWKNFIFVCDQLFYRTRQKLNCLIN